nr:hypothetical protein CFP56_03177 [Quercus suber]
MVTGRIYRKIMLEAWKTQRSPGAREGPQPSRAPAGYQKMPEPRVAEATHLAALTTPPTAFRYTAGESSVLSMIGQTHGTLVNTHKTRSAAAILAVSHTSCSSSSLFSCFVSVPCRYHLAQLCSVAVTPHHSSIVEK